MERDRCVFKGKLLKVLVRHRTLPNGFRVRLEIVRHPGAALIVPFLGRQTVIMLRQLRPVIGKYLYELPAGTLGRGETTAACARREIVEETGYRARVIRRLGMIYPVPGYSTERIVIYRAEGLTKVSRRPEDDEVIETVILTKRELKTLFKRGKIVDAKTVAALAFCGWL